MCAAGWHEADWEERGVRCLGMEGKGEAKQKKTCNFKAISKLWLRAQPIRFVQGFPRGHSTPLPWRAGCEPYLGGLPAPRLSAATQHSVGEVLRSRDRTHLTAGGAGLSWFGMASSQADSKKRNWGSWSSKNKSCSQTQPRAVSSRPAPRPPPPRGRQDVGTWACWRRGGAVTAVLPQHEQHRRKSEGKNICE